MPRRKKTLHELADMVPRDKKVAVSDRELPHVSNRPHVYTLRDGLYDADFLLYSTYNPRTLRLGGKRGETQRKKGTYTLVKEQDGLVLLTRAEPKGQPAGEANSGPK